MFGRTIRAQPREDGGARARARGALGAVFFAVAAGIGLFGLGAGAAQAPAPTPRPVVDAPPAEPAAVAEAPAPSEGRPPVTPRPRPAATTTTRAAEKASPGETPDPTAETRLAVELAVTEALADPTPTPSDEPQPEQPRSALDLSAVSGDDAPAALEEDLSPGPGAVALAPSPRGRPDALDLSPSENAVRKSPAPAPRPRSGRRSGGDLQEIGVKTVVATPRRPRPGPTAPGVAAAATLKSAMPLEKINLIGVYRGDAGRRALLRLPDGEIMRVGRGAVVDGWTVSTIERDKMRIVRSGEAQVLRIVK